MIRAVKLRTNAFRSAGVKYANEEDILSGSGASFHGGRWNPRGIRAIYASLDPITAVKESYHEFLKYGFASVHIRPRVMAGITVNVKRVLDLTDHRIRRKLRFSLSQLIHEDWQAIQTGGGESWTQTIGRGAKIAGFEALLAPSARDRNGKNVVIFPENVDRKSKVELMAKSELPPHPKDWPKQIMHFCMLYCLP